MRQWTHEELHTLIDSSSSLKAKSEAEHSFSRISSEEKEQGKLKMMEIYAEAVCCKHADSAREFVKEIFVCLRQERTLGELRSKYALQKLCHSPLGNNYICFC